MSGAGEHPKGHEKLFWRRLAHWGASKGPDWWVRYSPPFFGAAAAMLVPDARRAVLRNLHRVRGPASPVKDTRDVLATFASYASCIAEVLSNDAEAGPRTPRATIYGERQIHRALGRGKGLVLVTAHTAGWESVGPLLARDYRLQMMLVMFPEPDARARELHDHARERTGLKIAHVGDDPLASLPLLRHLKEGGVVSLQLDRLVPGMRTRKTRLLDAEGAIPEGPLRLAQLSGAPIIPVFCARTGYRTYVVEAFDERLVSRHPSEEELDDVAGYIADCMTRFVRAHPTQWFHFAQEPGNE
jgi:KDO2-lipid IV(A) lauroyltransferase